MATMPPGADHDTSLHVANPWIVADGETRLFASRCDDGMLAFPPLANDGAALVQLSPHGRIYAHTTVRPARASGLQPYQVAWVDFPEDVRVFGRVTGDPARPLCIGRRVAVEVVSSGDGEDYAFVAVPQGHADDA